MDMDADNKAVVIIMSTSFAFARSLLATGIRTVRALARTR
jgi:hypothetical protein